MVHLALFLLASVLVPSSVSSSTNNQFHIQTDEGPERYFKYQTQNGQYRKEKRLEDGTVIGSYAWIDDNGFLRQRDYIADNQGYRILQNKNVYVGKSINVGDAVKAAKKTVKKVPKPYNTPSGVYLPSKQYIPSSTLRPFFVSTTLGDEYLPPATQAPPKVYLPSTPEPPSIYLPSTPAPPSVYLPSKIEPPKVYLPSTPAPPKVYLPSTPTPPSVYLPSTIAPPKVYLPSTPAPPSVYLPQPVPTTQYLPPVNPSTSPSSVYLPSSTLKPPVASVSTHGVSIYSESSTAPPVLYQSASSPRPFTSSTPNSIYSATSPPFVRITPPPLSKKYVPAISLDTNSIEYDEGFTNPYIHQNGPTYPIDNKGRFFNPIGNGYDPQYPYYDGISVTNDGFRYYIPRAYHEEQSVVKGVEKSGSFGYIDPFGIRRVVYYNAGPGGFKHRKNNRYVGFNATPYDPRPY